MATPAPRRSPRSALAVGCALAALVGVGGALTLAVGGGLAAYYLYGGAAAVAPITIRNARADAVVVRCSTPGGGDAQAAMGAGETVQMPIAALPAACSATVDGGSVWEETIDTPPTAEVVIPAPVPDDAPEPTGGDASPNDAAAPAPASSPEAGAPTVIAAPAPPAAASPAAVSTARAAASTARKPAAPTPEPPPAPRPPPPPTPIAVSFADGSRKARGVTVTLDGASVGTVPWQGQAAVGLHSIAIQKGATRVECTIAAAGAPWRWEVDLAEPVCP